MSDFATKYNAAELIQHLGKDKLADDQELSEFIISQQEEQLIPLYLRVLVGLSAFIASLCFIGFLFVAKIIDFKNESSLIIWGIIFVAAAIGLLKVAGRKVGVKNDFFMQASFATIAVGKTLFVVGVAVMYESGWFASLALLVITGITYTIYRLPMDRFLSSFAVLFSLLANILWDRNINDFRELLLNGFILFLFIGAAVLSTHSKIRRAHMPLSYAFIFSLCACVLLLASQAKFGSWSNKELIDPLFINFVLTIGLIASFGWAAGSINTLKSEPLLLACLGAVFLGLISAPGIILSIGLLVLGYARHENLLLILGGTLLAVFLWFYYYNLDISLLSKSGILFSSGVLLMLGRFYLQYRGWDKGVSHAQ